MDSLVYLNGRFVESNDAKISLFDRGYLFGDSVFETMRSYAGRVFRLRRHLEYLQHSADIVGMRTPPVDELHGIVEECMSRSGLRDAYLRITLSRGEGPPGLGIEGCDSPILSVIVRQLSPYPGDAYAHGIPSTVVTTRKVPSNCLDPSMKTGNYLSVIQARRELAAKGMIEGVQLGVDSQVVTGTISNVFAIKENTLMTPHSDSGCRPGITREAILAVAPSVGLIAQETHLSMDDLIGADEVMFTNTLMECLPVATIDASPLPTAPGRFTAALREALHGLIAEEK